MAGLQKINVFRSLHKTKVRHRVNEIRGSTHQAFSGRRCPELLRVLELLKDVQRSANRHTTVLIA